MAKTIVVCSNSLVDWILSLLLHEESKVGIRYTCRSYQDGFVGEGFSIVI